MTDMPLDEAAHRGVDLAQTVMETVAADREGAALALIKAAPTQVLRVALGYYAANFHELLLHITERNEHMALAVIRTSIEKHKDDPLMAQTAAALMGVETDG